MIVKLLLAAIATEALYLALALRSQLPPEETIGARFYRPELYEETLEFYAIWGALCLLYALTIALARRGRRITAAVILLTSFFFRATLVALPNGLDTEEREVFLHTRSPTSAAVSAAGERVGPELPAAALPALFDFGALLVELGLLKSAGLPPALVVIHGWNPLAVKEASGSGRYEALSLLLLLSSIRLIQKGWSWGASILCGFALTGPGWLWLTLLPLGKALRWRLPFSVGLAIASWYAYGPELDWGERLGWPPGDHTGGSLLPAATALIRLLLTREPLVPALLAAAGWVGWAFLRASRRGPEPVGLPRETLLVTGVGLFLLPQVLPWTFLLFAYLAATSHNRGWILFTATAPLSYLALGGGGWSFWLGFAQYFFPFSALVFLGLGASRERGPA